MATTDCEGFVGRKLDICRGFDGEGRPVLTPEKCAEYRRSWGLPDQDDSQPIDEAHAGNRYARSSMGEDSTQHRTSPGLLQQAANFASALGKHIANGRKLVTDESYAARLATCAACPSFDAPTHRCSECGCRMDVKATWEVGSCPLALWPVLEPQELSQ
jgi:hypothetical protein